MGFFFIFKNQAWTYIFVNFSRPLDQQKKCDADCRITHVDTRWPGSVHDSHIWNNSNVFPIMQNLHARDHNFFLIGKFCLQ